jgi:hypothetical protein
MVIYKIRQDGYYGGSMLVPDGTKGIPLWTTRTAPPDIPEGKCARWAGNCWMIVNPPPVPEPESVPEDIAEDAEDSTLPENIE